MDYSSMDTAALIECVRCYCGNIMDLHADGRAGMADKWRERLICVLGVANNRAGAIDLLIHRLQVRKDHTDLVCEMLRGLSD